MDVKALKRIDLKLDYFSIWIFSCRCNHFLFFFRPQTQNSIKSRDRILEKAECKPEVDFQKGCHTDIPWSCDFIFRITNMTLFSALLRE